MTLVIPSAINSRRVDTSACEESYIKAVLVVHGLTTLSWSGAIRPRIGLYRGALSANEIINALLGLDQIAGQIVLLQVLLIFPRTASRISLRLRSRSSNVFNAILCYVSNPCAQVERAFIEELDNNNT